MTNDEAQMPKECPNDSLEHCSFLRHSDLVIRH